MVDNVFTGGKREIVVRFFNMLAASPPLLATLPPLLATSPALLTTPPLLLATLPFTYKLAPQTKTNKKTYPSLKGKIGCSRNSFINLLHGNFYISCRFHRSMVRYVQYLVVLLLAFSLVSCRRLLLSGLLLGLLPLLPFPDYCGFLLS
jgi:hypothetical protein